MSKYTLRCLVAVIGLMAFGPTHAQEDVNELRQALDELRNQYEQRISDLEKKLDTAIESKAAAKTSMTVESQGGRSVRGNEFNPSIGIILNGQFKEFSQRTAPELTGFAIGEEGERGTGGLGLDHTEINFSASIDDKFYGSLTYALVEEGGAIVTEVEEAYIQTLPGAGAPAQFKFGKALWTLGYLNEQHAHTDDFADRPLPYRIYLNGGFNDDGIQISKILPTEIYNEVGLGLFRGSDFPFGTPDGQGIGASSLFYRIGGDVGTNGTWRFGAYQVDGETGGRVTEEGTVTFIGDTKLTAYDIRYTFAPTGNERSQEVTLTAEHFTRSENGTYGATGDEAFATSAYDAETKGWYVAATYKWMPQARVGVRYSEMSNVDLTGALDGTAVDGAGFKPTQLNLMFDWTNSEYSRIRLQLGSEELSTGNEDDQIILQYLMSFGAHGAHKY
jgi:Sec-independent protein translocase protein TatA